MPNDYSEYQGSDYYHVPEKPKQNNLLDGFNAALQAFVSIRSKKTEIDDANAEKLKKEKLMGEKMQADKEDRDLSRSKTQSEIDYNTKRTKLLGTEKPSSKSSSTSSSKGKSSTNAVIDTAMKTYDQMMKDEALARKGKIKNIDEFGMETEIDDPEALNKLKESDTYKEMRTSIYTNLKDAQESGMQLSMDQLRILSGLEQEVGGNLPDSVKNSGKFMEQNPPPTQGDKRPDGTEKGNGFLGKRDLGNGNVATEYSIGVNFDGEEVLIPTYVPTLTKEELSRLDAAARDGRQPDKDIVQKAVDFARTRKKQGLPYFSEGNEAQPQQQSTEGPALVDLLNQRQGLKGGSAAPISATYKKPEVPVMIDEQTANTDSPVVKKVSWLVGGAYDAAKGFAKDTLAPTAEKLLGIATDNVRDMTEKFSENIRGNIQGSTEWINKNSQDSQGLLNAINNVVIEKDIDGAKSLYKKYVNADGSSNYISPKGVKVLTDVISGKTPDSSNSARQALAPLINALKGSNKSKMEEEEDLMSRQKNLDDTVIYLKKKSG